MDHHTGPLDMAQELVSESRSLGSALNESRDIRNDESPAAVHIHNAQVRIQCRKMIVGDLRTGVADSGKECGLSDIREAYQPHIRNHLELQAYFQFLGVLTRLCILGNLHGGGGVIHIALSASAAF